MGVRRLLIVWVLVGVGVEVSENVAVTLSC